MLNEGLLPGPAPIGYLNTKDENGKKTIIIDPDRGHFIKKLFEEYSTGLFSMDELVKKSKNWGLRNRKVATRLPKPNLQIFCKIHFIMGLCITTKAIFRIFMKNSFPKSCLINAPKCGQESSNEHPSIPKNPISLGGWFAANIAVVCFRLIQRRGSMFICGIQTSRIANTVIISVRKFC